MENLTFGGSQELANEFIKQAERHYKADSLVTGLYGDDRLYGFVGCSVGCHAKDIGFVFSNDSGSTIHEFVANH